MILYLLIVSTLHQSLTSSQLTVDTACAPLASSKRPASLQSSVSAWNWRISSLELP